MALIECPDCKMQISDKSDKCIHCGCKITVCPVCHKIFAGEVQVCPNCGEKLQTDSRESNDDFTNINTTVAINQKNTYAIMGFVFSFFIPILGLIFSIMGINASKTLNGKGQGLAIAGIVLAIISWIINVIVLIYLDIFL